MTRSRCSAGASLAPSSRGRRCTPAGLSRDAPAAAASWPRRARTAPGARPCQVAHQVAIVRPKFRSWRFPIDGTFSMYSSRAGARMKTETERRGRASGLCRVSCGGTAAAASRRGSGRQGMACCTLFYHPPTQRECFGPGVGIVSIQGGFQWVAGGRFQGIGILRLPMKLKLHFTPNQGIQSIQS